jgi:hypothetical protein
VLAACLNQLLEDGEAHQRAPDVGPGMPVGKGGKDDAPGAGHAVTEQRQNVRRHVRDHGVEVGGGGGPGGGMRIQGAVDTATSLDHRHRRGDQARARGRGSRGSGPAGGTGPARRKTSSDTQRDPTQLDAKASGFQAFARTAERLATFFAVARLARLGEAR